MRNLQVQRVEEEDNILASILAKIDVLELTIDHSSAGEGRGRLLKIGDWHLEGHEYNITLEK